MLERIKKREPKSPPTTTTTTTPAPVVTPQPERGGPTGPIKTLGGTTDWADITRYDRWVREQATPVGWPLERLRGTMAIESRGNPRAVQKNNTNGWSYGLFQIVPYGVGWNGWHSLVKEKAGLPANASQQKVIDALYDPKINIAVAVAILESLYQSYGTLDKASSAFFCGKPGWGCSDTVNGTQGLGYRDTLAALIKEQDVFAPPDVISFIVSERPYTAEFGFNQPNYDVNGVPQNYYHYGVGHGTNAPHMHTGIDIVVPLYTPLRTPLSGVVRCVGNAGSGDWGQACGSFPDTVGGGIGNVTILTDAGLKLTFGHVNSSTRRPGERVAAGDVVAKSGGMVGPHLHLDASVNRNGSYWLLDPIPAIARALGQDVPEPPPSYADPVAIPQPGEFDSSVTVTATQDNVPVLQYANRGSASTNKPLAKGDEFEAVYQVLGDAGEIFWVSTRGSRVPVLGTTAPDWHGGGTPVTCPPVTDLPGLLLALETERGQLITDINDTFRDLAAEIQEFQK
jgi:murein DD-endopeptidase MepM/ murein hydrolase activator NlpD